MLTELGFSESTGGIVSSVDTISAAVGAIMLPLVMHGKLKKKDKVVYFAIFLICNFSFSLLFIQMPAPKSWFKPDHKYPSIVKPLLPLIFAGSIIGGVAAGMAYPLFFESAAEITFPVSEGISGAAITFATTITYFVALFIFGLVGSHWTTLVSLSFGVVGTILIPFLKITFNRSEVEE